MVAVAKASSGPMSSASPASVMTTPSLPAVDDETTVERIGSVTCGCMDRSGSHREQGEADKRRGQNRGAEIDRYRRHKPEDGESE